MDPHCVVRGGGEGYCQAGVPAQAVFARVSREERQSVSTLVRARPMAVGSGRVFMHISSIIRTYVLASRRLLPILDLLTLRTHTRSLIIGTSILEIRGVRTCSCMPSAMERLLRSCDDYLSSIGRYPNSLHVSILDIVNLQSGVLASPTFIALVRIALKFRVGHY